MLTHRMASLASHCGIYLLAERHLPAVQQLAGAAAVAATTRLPHPYPVDGAQVFYADLQQERARGTAQVFAIEDRGRVVGLCGLHGIGATAAELGYWIGEPFWGRGYATFAVAAVLPFAFDNLRLREVWAEVLATNTRSHRVLAKCGFQVKGERVHGEPQWPAAVPLVRHAIDATAWRAWRAAPALAALHPALQAILAAELAAGNEVVETGQGWPDPDSVFVRVRKPFATLPQPLPDGVLYHQLQDPHWWKAEVATLRPRHTIAY